MTATSSRTLTSVGGGATNASGSDVADYGWSRQRYVYAEDIEATIYSALGIDWTTEIHDRLGRPLPATRGQPVLELFS